MNRAGQIRITKTVPCTLNKELLLEAGRWQCCRPYNKAWIRAHTPICVKPINVLPINKVQKTGQCLSPGEPFSELSKPEAFWAIQLFPQRLHLKVRESFKLKALVIKVGRELEQSSPPIIRRQLASQTRQHLRPFHALRLRLRPVHSGRDDLP